MSRYVSVIERVLAKTTAPDPDARQALYARGRQAILQSFENPEKSETCRQELKLLDEAVVIIEARIQSGEVFWAPPKPLPKADEQQPPDLELFANARQGADPQNDGSSEDQGVTPSRLGAAALLLLIAAVGGVMLLQPNLLGPAPTRLKPAILPTQSPVTDMGTTKWASGRQSGTISWTHEKDGSTIAPRSGARSVLTGRANLQPLAPPVTIHFIPTARDGLRASHVLEFRFAETDGPAVVGIDQFLLKIKGDKAAEPDGVIVRTSSHSFAYIFSNAGKSEAVNDAILREVSKVSLVLRLERGSPVPLDIETVELK